MLPRKLFTWTAILIFILVFYFFGLPFSVLIAAQLSLIGFPLGLVLLVGILLPIVVFLEVVLRISILQGLAPLKFMPAEPEDWPLTDQSELSHYTEQLEQLGFQFLTDYTLKTYQQINKPIARLFAHPQARCYAEVAQVGSAAMFCGFSCQLEDHWSLAMYNTARDDFPKVSHVLLAPPKTKLKQHAGAPVDRLFKTFLNWRKDVRKAEGAEPIPEVETETFFQAANDRRTVQRKLIMGQSITLALIDLWLLQAKFEAKTKTKAATGFNSVMSSTAQKSGTQPSADADRQTADEPPTDREPADTSDSLSADGPSLENPSSASDQNQPSDEQEGWV